MYARVKGVDGTPKNPKATLHVYYAEDQRSRHDAEGMLISQDGKRVLAAFDQVPESVTIPNGIVEICADAFNGRDIRTVILPDTLERIGDRAFKLTLIEQVSLPANVSHIGKEAFTCRFESQGSRVGKPTWIDVDQGNEAFCSQEGSLIEKSGAERILVSAYYSFGTEDPSVYGETVEVAVPEGVTRMGSRCLMVSCSRDKIRLDLPETLEVIEPIAISHPNDAYGERNVQFLYIGRRLTEIADDFWECISQTPPIIAKADGGHAGNLLCKFPISKGTELMIHPGNARYSMRNGSLCITRKPSGGMQGVKIVLADGMSLPMVVRVIGLGSLSEYEKRAVESLEQGQDISLAMGETQLRDDRGKRPKDEVALIGFDGLSDMGYLEGNWFDASCSFNEKAEAGKPIEAAVPVRARVASVTARGKDVRVPELALELSESERR